MIKLIIIIILFIRYWHKEGIERIREQKNN